MRLWPWLDEAQVAVTVIDAGSADLSWPLSHHDWGINAIRDADAAAGVLASAAEFIPGTGQFLQIGRCIISPQAWSRKTTTLRSVVFLST